MSFLSVSYGSLIVLEDAECSKSSCISVFAFVLKEYWICLHQNRTVILISKKNKLSFRSGRIQLLYLISII